MYIPRHFEGTNLPVLHALVGAHPLATWVTQSASGAASADPAGGALNADHVPLLLDAARGELGTLVGIEIAITSTVGKWKVSQNRSLDDRVGVVAGLVEQNTGRSKAMASLVELYSGIAQD